MPSANSETSGAGRLYAWLLFLWIAAVAAFYFRNFAYLADIFRTYLS